MIKKPDPDSLTLTGHLDELRSRLLSSLGFLLAGVLVSLFFARQLAHFLTLPSRGIITQLVITKPTESVVAYFKIALCCGFLIASPVLLYHAWQFFKPALREKVSLWGWILSGTLLFAGGTVFSYLVIVPMSLKILMGMSAGLATPFISLQSYLSFVLSLTLLGGAMFEMPVAAALLTVAGVLSPDVMRCRRREAIFALCAAAAVLTPTTDIFSLLIFVIPMLVLYEASIIVSRCVSRTADPVPGEELYEKL